MHAPVTIALCLIHWCFWDPFHKFLFQKTPYHIMPLHISAGNWWYDKSFADIQCMSYTPFNRAKYKFSNSKPLVLRLYTIWVEGWRGWRGWCGHWSRWRCSAPSCVWSLYSCPTERSSPATARTALLLHIVWPVYIFKKDQVDFEQLNWWGAHAAGQITQA